MKWNCELIQDLLPLYAEGLCSGASRQAVEEHLSECAVCRRLNGPLPIEVPAEPENADRAVKKSIRKVRRRWLASLLAVVLIVPVLLMAANQVRGRGVCFANLGDITAARRFLRALETGDWEKAAAMHDYSGDYESILEALAWPVEDWGMNFVPLRLEGYSCMASVYLQREGLVPEGLEELYGFLYNRQGTAMIPAELWEQLMTIDPAAFERSGGQYWLNGELYGRISTPWGDFVVSEGRSFNSAYEYCSYFDLIPAAIYEEAKPELEDEARRLYDNTHAAYDYVARMTEAEFLEHMERSYAADLRELEGVIAFDCTGYHGARLLWENDGWHIEFGVTLTYGDKSLDTDLALGVEDGRVCVVSLAYREPADWLEELERALYPSAHPGY